MFGSSPLTVETSLKRLSVRELKFLRHAVESEIMTREGVAGKPVSPKAVLRSLTLKRLASSALHEERYGSE